MRAQRERNTKVWAAFGLLATVLAASIVGRYRADRRDYVLLIDPATGRTIAELKSGSHLVGETATHAVFERLRKRQLIKLPSADTATQPTISQTFSLGGTPPPEEGMSWWLRPRERTNAAGHFRW
jgi:hypothetical protein